MTDWVADVIAAAALAFTVVAWLGSRREAVKAEKASADSAKHAARAVTAAEQSASALDRSVSLAEEEAARSDIGWRLEPQTETVVLLRNTAVRDTAHGVKVEGGVIKNQGELEWLEIGPGSAVEFKAYPDGGTSEQDRIITVRWCRQRRGLGVEYEPPWSQPLPR